MELRDLLLALVLVWLAAKVAGEGMERIGQTAVLGELLAGVVIGPGVLGLVPQTDTLHALAELGILILLFEVGLESDLHDLLRTGLQATLVAVIGVVVPLAAGYGVMHWLGYHPLVCVFVGATLTATSVGITARVLTDLGRLQDAAAKLVLGAAVVDDVLGLIMTRGSLIVYAMVFAVALAAFADWAGLATIIGAFAAGLVLATTERREHIEQRLKPVADLLVPVFFVTVGMKVQPSMLNPFAQDGHFGVAVVLVAVAVASKLAAGLAVYQKGVRRWPVGVGMVPRGEVGLIFAGAGLAAGVIAQDLYSALVMVVMLTTLVAPPWLKALYD